MVFLLRSWKGQGTSIYLGQQRATRVMLEVFLTERDSEFVGTPNLREDVSNLGL